MLRHITRHMRSGGPVVHPGGTMPQIRPNWPSRPVGNAAAKAFHEQIAGGLAGWRLNPDNRPDAV